MNQTVEKSMRILTGLILFAAISFFSSSLQAQELRGKITGRVMDPNGAAVPGANVKVTDVARNKIVDLTTNSEGLFEAPFLLPGTYQVMVEMAGFKKSLQQTVQVAINETRNLDIKMDIGTPSET